MFSLLKLIKLVSSKNILLRNLKKNIVDDKTKFVKELEYISNTKNELIRKQDNLFKLINNIINFENKEDINIDDILININNETNNVMEDIIELLKEIGKTKKQVEFLKNITKFGNISLR